VGVGPCKHFFTNLNRPENVAKMPSGCYGNDLVRCVRR